MILFFLPLPLVAFAFIIGAVILAAWTLLFLFPYSSFKQKVTILTTLYSVCTLLYYIYALFTQKSFNIGLPTIAIELVVIAACMILLYSTMRGRVDE